MEEDHETGSTNMSRSGVASPRDLIFSWRNSDCDARMEWTSTKTSSVADKDPWNHIQADRGRMVSTDSGYFSAPTIENQNTVGQSNIPGKPNNHRSWCATVFPQAEPLQSNYNEARQPLSQSVVCSIMPQDPMPTQKSKSLAKRVKRVRRHLSEEGRKHASLVRKFGACAICRKKKVKVCLVR